MNTRHSPGPWTAKPQRLLRAVPITSAAGLVAMTSNAGDPQQIAANARLMAAAPELLAALDAVCNRGTRADFDRARELLTRIAGGAA